MKKFSLLMALCLSLFACGQQEKVENPFGKTKDPSTDPSMSEREFKDDCARKNGYFLANDTICYHVPHKFALTEDLEKELNEKGSLNVLIGAVTQGAMLWGSVKGGQRVNFDLNGTLYTHMTDGPLAKTPLIAGRLTMRVEAGAYEHLNAYVAQCYTRSGSVPCPPN
jgi:hypothetical protein